MSGGIIIRRARVLITAATDTCLYDSLPAAEKAEVETIKAKDPASWTEYDLQTLVKILKIAIHH